MAKIDIFIIDDSPAFNQLTKILIERSGVDCTIKQLSNGQLALKYIEDNDLCPALILLDINMPVMDGFDFLEAYASRPAAVSTTSVYMLTSSPDEQDRTRAKKYNIVKGYFEKPLTEENLAQIMTDLTAIG